MPPRRRAARRTGRRRVHRRRRRRRRRILIGGAVLVAAGAAAYGAYKLSQNDVDRIEQQTGQEVEELTDEELQGAMSDLDIQSQELNDEDKAALGQSEGSGEAKSEGDYLDELERLADLKERGIISEQEFEAKKQEILGL